MADKIFPKGIQIFPKHSNAPSFVKGSMVITPNDLVAWLRENASLLTDYKGTRQLRLDILEGQKGLYVAVNTFTKKEDKLPF